MQTGCRWGWTLKNCRRWAFAHAVMAVVAMATTNAAKAQVYFTENFDSLVLDTVVDEPIPEIPGDDRREAVFSPTGPAGWAVDRTNTPAGGVTEWRGWNWVDPVWWSEVAGQERANFATGDQGLVIAVADSDEWDDKSHDPGAMNTILSTPQLPLAGLASGTNFEFDTSWRAEPSQFATLRLGLTSELRWRFSVGNPMKPARTFRGI